MKTRGSGGKALPTNKHTATSKSQARLKAYEVIWSGGNTKIKKRKTSNLSWDLEYWLWSPSLAPKSIKIGDLP